MRIRFYQRNAQELGETEIRRFLLQFQVEQLSYAAVAADAHVPVHRDAGPRLGGAEYPVCPAPPAEAATGPPRAVVGPVAGAAEPEVPSDYD